MTVRFGILGCGKIALRFIAGCKAAENAEVAAVAARELERAAEYAERFGISKAYGSYKELLEDEEVEAVYIATPPFVHGEQIRMCLAAGKHVLCEKPFVKSAAEAKELFALARSKGLLLMEANKTLFTPTLQTIKKWIDDKKVGKVQYLEGSHCSDGHFPADHWVLSKEKVGGGMYDVGVYPLTVSNYLLGEVESYVKCELLNERGYDELTVMTIRYKSGAVACVKGALAVEAGKMLTIYGTDGRIDCQGFSKGRDCTLTVYGKEDEITRVHHEFESEFQFEIEHFASCIRENRNESPIMSEAMSVQVLKMIEGK